MTANSNIKGPPRGKGSPEIFHGDALLVHYNPGDIPKYSKPLYDLCPGRGQCLDVVLICDERLLKS